MEEKEYVFEVITYYKSGRIKTDYINADTETKMWEIYDGFHRKSFIESSVIQDCWPQ